ncbi:hypothetical protein Tco_1320217 [Tanacetum coccineum]
MTLPYVASFGWLTISPIVEVFFDLPNVDDVTFELRLLWSCLGLFLFVMALFIHALLEYEHVVYESDFAGMRLQHRFNSTNTVNAASTNEVNVVGEKTSIELSFDLNMPALEDVSIFDFSRDDEDDGEEADMNNLDTTIQVGPIPTTRIHKDHPLDQVIGDLQSATQTRRMSKKLEEHGFFSTIQQRTNHKDLQNCLFAYFLSQKEPKKEKKDVGIKSLLEVTVVKVLRHNLEWDAVTDIYLRIPDFQ